MERPLQLGAGAVLDEATTTISTTTNTTTSATAIATATRAWIAPRPQAREAAEPGHAGAGSSR